MQERIVPLYNDEILEEYKSVLSRPKFNLNLSLIETIIKAIITDGLNIDRTPTADIEFPDPKDIVFYEVALSVEDSYHACRNGPYLRRLEFFAPPDV